MARANKKKHGFLKRYTVDEGLAENGAWLDFGDGVEVQIRSANSKRASEVLDRLYAPYRALVRTKKMPEELDADLMKRWAAEGLIADWRGMPNDDGTVIEYSVENALGVCKALPEFALDVINIAKGRDAFQPFDPEDVAGNSPAPSSGKATTLSA